MMSNIQIQVIVYQIKQIMQGKYFDNRVHKHFVHTYSRVPYLDTEIFNAEQHSLRQSRRAQQRAAIAAQGLKRTAEKSEKLSASLRDSRIQREADAQNFLTSLQKSQNECLQKQKEAWKSYQEQKRESRISQIEDQKYLEGLLRSNSTKAESRLTSVRRWY